MKTFTEHLDEGLGSWAAGKLKDAATRAVYGSPRMQKRREFIDRYRSETGEHPDAKALKAIDRKVDAHFLKAATSAPKPEKKPEPVKKAEPEHHDPSKKGYADHAEFEQAASERSRRRQETASKLRDSALGRDTRLGGVAPEGKSQAEVEQGITSRVFGHRPQAGAGHHPTPGQAGPAGQGQHPEAQKIIAKAHAKAIDAQVKERQAAIKQREKKIKARKKELEGKPHVKAAIERRKEREKWRAHFFKEKPTGTASEYMDWLRDHRRRHGNVPPVSASGSPPSSR